MQRERSVDSVDNHVDNHFNQCGLCRRSVDAVWTTILSGVEVLRIVCIWKAVLRYRSLYRILRMPIKQYAGSYEGHK